MDQNFNQKLKAAAFVMALMMMSACSSSQVGENGAVPAETAAAANPGEATTDAVPPVTDPNAPPPVSDPSLVGAPPEAQAAAAGNDAPVVEDPNLASAPPPAPDQAPPVDPALDIPTSVPADSTVVAANDPQVVNPTMTDPAPIGQGDLPVAAVQEENHEVKRKHKKGKKKAQAQEAVAASGDASSGQAGNYTVQRGDTLMKIAFEQYGDLYRWKEILEANRGRIQDPNHIPPGTHLTLNGAGMTTIEHNGERYLIKHGETLGVISKNVYGTPRRWKRLWENNRQLIKDPNKIYAGFYLFYQPEGKLTHDSVAPAGDGSAANQKVQAAPAMAPAPQAPAAAAAVAAPRSPASAVQSAVQKK